MGIRPIVGYCAKGLYLCSVSVFSKVPGLQFHGAGDRAFWVIMLSITTKTSTVVLSTIVEA